MNRYVIQQFNSRLSAIHSLVDTPVKNYRCVQISPATDHVSLGTDLIWERDDLAVLGELCALLGVETPDGLPDAVKQILDARHKAEALLADCQGDVDALQRMPASLTEHHFKPLPPVPPGLSMNEEYRKQLEAQGYRSM